MLWFSEPCEHLFTLSLAESVEVGYIGEYILRTARKEDVGNAASVAAAEIVSRAATLAASPTSLCRYVLELSQ